MTCPRCPHCRGSVPRVRKVKAKRLASKFSVSAKAYAVIKKAATERGWSMARLVEEATKHVTISSLGTGAHDASVLAGASTTYSPVRVNGGAGKLSERGRGNF